MDFPSDGSYLQCLGGHNTRKSQRQQSHSYILWSPNPIKGLLTIQDISVIQQKRLLSWVSVIFCSTTTVGKPPLQILQRAWQRKTTCPTPSSLHLFLFPSHYKETVLVLHYRTHVTCWSMGIFFSTSMERHHFRPLGLTNCGIVVRPTCPIITTSHPTPTRCIFVDPLQAHV